MIELNQLRKRYGDKVAVDGISAVIRPGIVTGFLGPNGSGKSTTMRLIVGLDNPSSGDATVNGKAYAKHRAPLHEVGALLEARAVHTGRSAFNHLWALAATHGIPKSRVHEVIELAGLSAVANKRVGKFSLGMGQRLGIAAALLGDPKTLILDEPVNGLDPEGVTWVRQLLRHLASEGRTVFLSSHLMSEMAQTADHVIVLGRGRILADAPVKEIIAQAGGGGVRARTPKPQELRVALEHAGAQVAPQNDGSLMISGLDAPAVGDIALAAQVALHELSAISGSLEDAYLGLTQGEVEYKSAGAKQ